MTRSLSTVAALLLVFVSSSRPARASDQSPQSPSDQVKAGMVVSIVDDAGREVNGRVDSISDQVIRVARRGRIEAVPLPTIVRIEKPDTLRNGALTGFTIGASTGLLLVFAGNARKEPWIIAWATFGHGAVYSAIAPRSTEWSAVNGRSTSAGGNARLRSLPSSVLVSRARPFA